MPEASRAGLALRVHLQPWPAQKHISPHATTAAPCPCRDYDRYIHIRGAQLTARTSDGFFWASAYRQNIPAYNLARFITPLGNLLAKVYVGAKTGTTHRITSFEMHGHGSSGAAVRLWFKPGNFKLTPAVRVGRGRGLGWLAPPAGLPASPALHHVLACGCGGSEQLTPACVHRRWPPFVLQARFIVGIPTIWTDWAAIFRVRSCCCRVPPAPSPE